MAPSHAKAAIARPIDPWSLESLGGDGSRAAGSHFRAAIIPQLSEPMRPRWGSEHGGTTMTDSENWKERRNQVARYRAMERETTDPLAARLLRDIVLDLEAELEGSPKRRP
jgi:hypothetical protein